MMWTNVGVGIQNRDKKLILIPQHMIQQVFQENQ